MFEVYGLRPYSGAMRALLITIMLLCALPGLALAKGKELPRTAKTAAHVGKLDGAKAPTLPAIGMPSISEDIITEKMPDTTLATQLEKAKEWALAALEWQRVAEGSKGKGRLKAIEHAAKSYEQVGQNEGAARMWRQLATERTGQERMYALYRLSQLVNGDERREIISNLKAFGGPFAEAVLYRAVWEQAQTGPVTETYGLQKAAQLQQRLAEADTMLRRRAAMAAALGVVPGMGHAYAGKTSVAAGLLCAWSLLGWLFLWCWRRRWWPFVVLWMIPFSILWGTSPGMAGTTADAQNAKLRQTLLKDWTDLHPVDPVENNTN
ncbi:MAG TPA: hypothetical protein VHP58_06165 [Alphaproteobacteria bacterium]|nr:hypothetical protein [Alphaproteobacteria bacterium]